MEFPNPNQAGGQSGGRRQCCLFPEAGGRPGAVVVAGTRSTGTSSTGSGPSAPADAAAAGAAQLVEPLFPNGFDMSMSPDNLDKLQKGIRIKNCGTPGSDFRPEFYTLTKSGAVDKVINGQNWKAEYAPFFRKLELGNITEHFDMHSSIAIFCGLNVSRLFIALAPHITSLKFEDTPSPYWISDLSLNVDKLPQFLAQFTNLHEVQFDQFRTPSQYKFDLLMQQILPKLKSSIPSIVLSITPKHCIGATNVETLIELRTVKMPNLKIVIEDIMDLEILEELSTKFKMLETLDLESILYRCNFFVYTYADLEKISSITTGILSVELYLVLNFKHEEETDMVNVNNCLIQLSSILTGLTVHCKPIPNWLLPDCTFPKLTKLLIHEYEYPFEMLLKQCPKLLQLTLSYMKLDAYIPFHDPAKLKECFSNLPSELESLTFDSKGHRGETGEWESQLKELLPNELKIKFC